MKTKTSHLATGGTTKKSPVSRNGIVPVAVTADTRGPSDLWKDVSKTDISTGFEVVKDAFPDESKTVLRKARKKSAVFERMYSNKFVHIKGEGSKFVWFEVLPPQPQVVDKPKKRKPINYKNKLTPKTRDKFTDQLDRHINNTASFIMKELLPSTMSLHSAVLRVNELTQQLVDEKVQLPLQYLQSKQNMAVHLRIIRHVSDQFGLTEEERKLMALEYTRPWSQS